MARANFLKKKKTYLIVVSIIVVMSFIFTLYFSSHHRGERKELDERVEIAVSILNSFGYGGIIHDFKNYLLRGEIKDYRNVQRKFFHIKELVHRYNIKKLSLSEKIALRQVLQTAAEYAKKLEVIKDKRKQADFSISNIDKRVKIDDSAALGSMALLLKSLKNKILEVKKVSDKINFITILFFFLILILVCVLYFNEIKSLEKVNKELMTANEELGQFSYRTSHDLKGPLVTVKSLSDFMVEDIADGNYEEVNKNAFVIQEHVTKLARLVEDILNLAKADLGFLETTKIDIDEIFSEVKKKLKGLYQDSDIVFMEAYNHNHDLFASRVRITQILENLFSNSIKYRDKEKKETQIKLTTHSDEMYFYIKLEDNGLGIPVEFQDHVFNMFERFHQNISFGSGLGMYIIKKNIDKMDAQINFESSSAGTTFKIKLKRNG